ncbi:hypothetical protein B1R32_102171 [Abditibacterium utsteinense]|uniref:Uncharacterized protein n=1 Tax=Abditibacterium utsteinense TaxID=1960156 RepID=A0A2S8SWJ5_9BACT|nr:hypothetical protein B1R32_102171 [Abditibacterium utsteinense]
MLNREIFGKSTKNEGRKNNGFRVLHFLWIWFQTRTKSPDLPPVFFRKTMFSISKVSSTPLVMS